MPSSKRSKPVVLTQTDKKNREHKSAFIQQVRDAVDDHDTLYMFSYENMRSNHFKNVRLHFRDDKESKSRIFLGKNKLMQIALGRNPEDEYADNIREVSKRITGSVGLLFTTKSESEVEEYFLSSSSFEEEDFARAGFTSPRTVTLTNEMVTNHPVSMVEQFRKLGMPVEVKNGKVVLINNRSDFVVCREGKALSAEQCKILVHFGVKLATFQVRLVAKWSSESGMFSLIE
jgi:mRNA turnover protein 4